MEGGSSSSSVLDARLDVVHERIGEALTIGRVESDNFCMFRTARGAYF